MGKTYSSFALMMFYKPYKKDLSDPSNPLNSFAVLPYDFIYSEITASIGLVLLDIK
jgi:hypothetical protein